MNINIKWRLALCALISTVALPVGAQQGMSGMALLDQENTTTDPGPYYLPSTAPANASSVKDDYLLERDSGKNLIEGAMAFSKKQSATILHLAQNETDRRAKMLLTLWANLAQINQLSIAQGEAVLTELNNPLWREKFRRDWILELASRKNWQAILPHADLLIDPSVEHQCIGVLARAYTQSPKVLADQGMKILRDQNKPFAKSQSQCRLMLGELYRYGALQGEEFARLLRRLLYAGGSADFQVFPAEAVKTALSAPSLFNLNTFWDAPALLEGKINPIVQSWQNDGAKHSPWKVALLARIAAQEPERAARLYQRFGGTLQGEQNLIAQTYIGLGFAQSQSAQALPYLTLPIILSELWLPHQESVLRALIRTQRWESLRKNIESLPGTEQQTTLWRYWWAHSILADQTLNASVIAKALATDLTTTKFNDNPLAFAYQTLKQISLENDFYGALAADRIGAKINIPPLATATTSEEMTRARADECLAWASALIKLGGNIRPYGVAQWRQCLIGKNDRELMAISRLAIDRQLFDRAVNTAILTKKEHDWSLRFIKPFAEIVTPAAQAHNISPDWVYGLMRQESRFLFDAQSAVGARGMMQIMPKTGQYLARKAGLKNFQTEQLYDVATNTQLGTLFLQELFNRLGHIVLASAAYNAGPSRAQRWRPLSGTIPAEVYIETIPFSETRQYVKNVLWNTTIYQILGGQSQATISAWLSPINATTVATDDLP